ncbi:MAG: phenylacetate--CoA ligase family protein [Bacteroidales bacterium]|nr:phenylacetate--CoA ligase family protein [Bacteroidales bacterium]
MKTKVQNLISEKIILPLSDLATHQSISKTLNFLMKSQWWSESDLKEYQNEKLRQLIKHAYDNIPYYNDIFKERGLTPKDIQTSDDLIKLPILTKDNIRTNIRNKKIIAKNISKKHIIHQSSSGSTGEPLQYYNTNYALGFNLACAIRAWYWMGYRLGDKYVKISQYDRPIHKKIQDLMNRSKYLPAKELNNKYFNKIVNEMNKYQPKIIRGYPDQMLFLANYVKENNLNIYIPKAIATTGSTLRKSTRESIETYLKSNVYDSYRCEGGANVTQCENRHSYHSSMEYAITEIMYNGKEVEKGERGRLITTDLVNYAVPFIRYDTQDIVTKSNEKCSCGRNLLAIKKIDGRDSDFLITPSGKFLIDVQFDGWFPEIESIEQFQITQVSIDHIIMKFVVNEKYNKREQDRIYNYWQKYIGYDVKLEIQVVDNIQFTKSGKRRYIIRDKSITLPF